MVYCVAVGCTNGTNFGGSFYQFPKDKKIRKIWTINLKRDGFNPDDHYQPVLCSEHFESDCWDRNPAIARACGLQVRLKKTATPTIFSWKRAADSPACTPAPKRRRSNAVMKRQNLEVSAQKRLVLHDDHVTVYSRPGASDCKL